MERINFLVVGTGINVNTPGESFPEEIKGVAASLFQIKNRPVARLELIKQYLREFENCYRIWMSRGFGPVLEEWKNRSVSLNRPVRVSTFRETWDGWAEDVDDSGALVMRMPDGSLKSFVAGEVSLRNA